MAIQILIVDDSAIFREGLRVLLEAHVDWEVCGEAVGGMEGVQKNRLLKPHLVIMDLSMPRMSGIEAAAEILKEFPKVPILLLTLYVTRQLTQEAHKLGIRATLSKTATHHLFGSIEAILRGEEFKFRSVELKNSHSDMMERDREFVTPNARHFNLLY